MPLHLIPCFGFIKSLWKFATESFFLNIFEEVTKQNIVLQLQHLKTHPAVFSRLSTGELQIHGWVYDIKSGSVEGFDEATQEFKTL